MWEKTNVNDELNKPITLSEVKPQCEKSKANKAVGMDDIANELMKHERVIQLIFKLFQKIFDTRLLPEIWRKAIIYPIPKESGHLTDPLKYRGLALQCCLYKLLSGLINDRVTCYFDKMEMLCDEQNGFRRHRSCQHHIFNLTSVVRNRICNGEQTYCAFVDFRKAFDVINRQLLVYSLVEKF